MRTSWRLALVASSLWALSAPMASAQTLEEEMAAEEGSSSSVAGDGEVASDEGTGDGAVVSTLTVDGGVGLSDDQAELEEVQPIETQDDGISPGERADTDYFFAGAFFRTLFVPDFIQGLFVTYEGGTAVNFGGGGYFGWRRNGFNVVAEVWYAGFYNQGFYHGAGAEDSEFEQVTSNLGVVFGSFLFGWTFTVTEWFGIDLGFGLGIGGMVGSLYRQEAYREAGAGTRLRPCNGVSSPDPGYCDSPAETRGPDGRIAVEGGTYQNGTAGNPFYFGDGGVPPMFFWLDLPRVGLNFRPIRQLQIQVNGGYNLYGFNVGASAGYGF